ncbi:hypothetical protein BVRB_038860 [Beta vulgaris subsp. vulgaris]|uniref:UBA domain-containing protein n=1 Tax=Beta vulgaris subsp. vulgaris TaxID=3555 RepID=A0A0J8BHG1_BETVV|nr:hypothetical protein BVRB_038860 [Beta vulgaris subsp. vulgaris]
MGFPESRAVKALLLNGLNMERAMEWLLDHANDEDVDAPLTPHQISQLISSLIASQGTNVCCMPRCCCISDHKIQGCFYLEDQLLLLCGLLTLRLPTGNVHMLSHETATSLSNSDAVIPARS